MTRSLLLGAVAALAASCAVEPTRIPDFYRASVPPGTAPGTLLRREPAPPPAANARAERIVYASIGLDDAPRAVSAVVMFPYGESASGARPVVAWAHPTTGVAQYCAPSLREDFYATVQGLPDFLARGFVVVATDYPGLGTQGPHPYLVGVSEGRAVLDSVRAARYLAEAKAGTRYAVWGHSQGGQAALFAAQLAPAYAPELSLVGVATAAPATELATLFGDDIDTPLGRILSAYTFWSWSRVYGDSTGNIVAASADVAMDDVASVCAESLLQGLVLSRDAKPLAQAFLTANPTRVQPWRSIIAQNTPGRAAVGAPLFFAQGSADELVRPAVTEAYANSLCRGGDKVRYVSMPDVPHNPAGKAAAPAAAAWIADRFGNAPAPSDCAVLLR